MQTIIKSNSQNSIQRISFTMIMGIYKLKIEISFRSNIMKCISIIWPTKDQNHWKRKNKSKLKLIVKHNYWLKITDPECNLNI